MKLSRVGIDLAKNVYQLHGVDRSGKTIWKRRLKRHQWFKALLDKTEPGCEIGMEACAISIGQRSTLELMHTGLRKPKNELLRLWYSYRVETSVGRSSEQKYERSIHFLTNKNLTIIKMVESTCSQKKRKVVPRTANC